MSALRPLLFRLANWLKIANYWLVAQLAIGVLSLLRLVPPDKALNFADRLGRWGGPKVRRHRRAGGNPRQAVSEEPPARVAGVPLDDGRLLVHHDHECPLERDDGQGFVSGVQHQCAHARSSRTAVDGFDGSPLSTRPGRGGAGTKKGAVMKTAP